MRSHELAMARHVKRWIIGTIVACVIAAVGTIPFRGTRARRGEATIFTQRLEATPARLHARAIADEWRAAQMASRLAEERLAVRQRDLDRPVLIMASADSEHATLLARIRASLDSAWHSLGLAETKISVALVIDPIEGSDAALPRDESWGPSYLLPDSANRTLCLIRLSENTGWRRAILRRSFARDNWLQQWLKANLGPCAFLAAYGMPGRSVRTWLGNRGFDLALSPSWNDSTATSSSILRSDRGWWWPFVYHQSFPAVACLARRVAGCREAVLEGASDDRPRANRTPVVMTDRRFWQRQRLIDGSRYLADVARQVGRDRFLEFWNSPLSVDSALSRALRQPVGEWTAQWQTRFTPPIRLGSSAPAGASILAVILGIVAIASTAVTARKRQAR
jgi:hypothetical protein